MCLERSENPEQLPGQEKIALGIGVEVVSKLLQNTLRNSFCTSSAQVPEQERPYSVSLRHPEQVITIQVFSEQRVEVFGTRGASIFSGAYEEHSGFGALYRGCRRQCLPLVASSGVYATNHRTLYIMTWLQKAKTIRRSS